MWLGNEEVGDTVPLQEGVHDIQIKEDTGIGMGRVQVRGGTEGGQRCFCCRPCERILYLEQKEVLSLIGSHKSL